VTNDVLHRRQRTHHTDDESARLTKDCSGFFADKLTRMRQTIASGLRAARRFTFSSVPPYSGLTLDEFSFVTIDEARKVIMDTAVKSSPLDILPSPLLRECADVFAPIISHMANFHSHRACTQELSRRTSSTHV